jgi:hypothetical protein
MGFCMDLNRGFSHFSSIRLVRVSERQIRGDCKDEEPQATGAERQRDGRRRTQEPERHADHSNDFSRTAVSHQWRDSGRGANTWIGESRTVSRPPNQSF